jgi:hypothetical protein
MDLGSGWIGIDAASGIGVELEFHKIDQGLEAIISDSKTRCPWKIVRSVQSRYDEQHIVRCVYESQTSFSIDLLLETGMNKMSLCSKGHAFSLRHYDWVFESDPMLLRKSAYFLLDIPLSFGQEL